ncbi:MAG TPA: ThiF family adenylyltransferase [Candidatus Angelobacter sp.]|nr:ThiF family adenylyltransferase [Candidatus Angelobacter sp.]
MQRYSRHLVLLEVGPEGQRKLKHSSVLVAGLGGLGIPAAVGLVSAGVGRIGIVDSDVVQLSNLQRQFIFSKEDLGRRKVDTTKEKLSQINPNTRVTTHPFRLDSGNAMEVIREYNVVIDATDNLQSRYLINDACVLQGKPDVFASVLGFDGQASVFSTRDGPCYRCLYPEPPAPGSVKSCEEAGVLNVVPGIMGGIQANQVIGILLGKGTPLIGRLLVFNGLDNSFNEIRFRKNNSCAVCGANPSITRLVDYEEFCGMKRTETTTESDITASQLKATIDSGKRPVLLDVREPYEYSLCHLESSTLIPVEELPDRMGELGMDSEIVVYCHVGIRSTLAVKQLRHAGFANVKNLRGGIDAWAREVDTKMPRY